MDKKEPIILSLGGSLIVPNGGINTSFLAKFNGFIRKKVAEGATFFIVCGGGSTARHYRDAGKAVVGKDLTNDDLDWLGIHATRVNAHLLRTIFRDIAHPTIVEKYDRRYFNFAQPVVIAAGWKPGWSTDYCAVLLAQYYHAKTIINLSNVDMVYDKDPAKFKDAMPIEKTSWEYFQSLVGERWDPGLNVPFDPIASKLAQKLGLTVIILRGDNIDNLERVFQGKKFIGTVMAPFEVDAAFYDRAHFEGHKIGAIKKYSVVGRILIFLRDLYRALKIKIFLNPKSLLDVGCGTGEMVEILRFLGVDAHGLEISKYLLSLANPKAKQFLKFGNILSLPYKDNSFETVSTYDVLEHIPTEEIKTAVGECNRVTQKLVMHKIFTSENWWIKHFHPADISHVSIFNQAWWRKFWQANGMKQINTFFPGFPSFMETLFLLEKK